jgi:Rhodopirellula transposase DDE domain
VCEPRPPTTTQKPVARVTPVGIFQPASDELFLYGVTSKVTSDCLVEFAQRSHLTRRLAYYPPYHSKYNAIERCWGILEQHWNGAMLDSVDAAIQYAAP